MDHHPVLGNVVRRSDGGGLVGRVYTRTVVLWAVGLTMDPNALWDHVAVLTEGPRHPSTPVVRMATTATKRRGTLAKRLRKNQTFRSVLSLDVEYRDSMPNLKISARSRGDSSPRPTGETP